MIVRNGGPRTRAKHCVYIGVEISPFNSVVEN